MSPALLLTDFSVIQAELERLALFCEAQRDLLASVGTLIGDDNKVPAAQAASLFEATSAWAATLADRLDDAHQAAFGQLTILQGGRA